LSYAEAQARIDDERLDDELTKNLRLLNAFGKVFRKRRKENGALDLASAEVRFQIDSETQDPTDVATYQVLCFPFRLISRRFRPWTRTDVWRR